MEPYSLKDTLKNERIYHNFISSNLRSEKTEIYPTNRIFDSKSFQNPNLNLSAKSKNNKEITEKQFEKSILNFSSFNNFNKKKETLFDEAFNNLKKIENNNKLWPYSAIGLITAKFGNKDNPLKRIGTGVLIGPDILLTSAVNLFSDFEIGSSGKKLGEAFEACFYAGFDGESGIKCKITEWRFPYEFENVEQFNKINSELYKQKEKFNFGV